MARSRPHRQNTTIHQGITYNALQRQHPQLPGGALTNTITSSPDSGNTATPPPTDSIDTLDRNRCNT